MTNDPYDGPVGEWPEADVPKPGVDPRIAALRKETQMHTQPKQDINMTATETKISPHGSLTNLIDRLEHIYSYLAGLHNNMVDLNNKLGGPVPRENESSPDKSDNCLAIAHALVTDIENRLQKVESEIKRLHDNIGE